MTCRFFLGVWAVVVTQTGMGNERGGAGLVVDKGIILSWRVGSVLCEILP